MSACVADTHATIWFLTNKPLLSAPALAAIALALELPLVTRDGKITASGLRTIW